MSRHFKVHEVVTDERELEDLRVFARQPGRTIDEVHQWLLEKGYTLSRSAVGNWKAKLDQEVLAERFTRSNELAASIKAAIAGGNFGDVADAAAAQLTQVVLEQATKLQAEEQIDPLDVQRMSRALTNLVQSKVGLVKLLADKFDREMEQTAAEAKKAPEQIFTPERIAEARRRIFGV